MTAPYSDIIVERRGEQVWITLDRPHRLNAITPTMARELRDVFAGLADDDTARVVILRGSGRGFCAGLDIQQFAQSAGRAGAEEPGDGQNGQSGGGASQESREDSPLPDIIRLMRACPQPVIALVHGPACGGGFAFALAADVRIVGESARMNDAFVNLGVSGCELGVTFFLPRYVGLSVAAELMYTGRFIAAERAAAVGLASQVVPDEGLEAAGAQLAGEMLRVAPLALRKTKEVLNASLAMTSLTDVIDLEQATQRECISDGSNFQEGMRAFLEKRQPVFSRPVRAS